MPMPPLPPSVNPSKWKSAVKDAGKDADKAGVAGAIDKLVKAHEAVDSKLLAAAKPASLEEASKMRDSLDGHAKAIQAATEAAAALVKCGTPALGDYKKDKSKAELAKLLASLLADADKYATSLESAYDAAQAAAGDAVEKFEQAKKKSDAAAEKEGGDDAESAAMADEKDDKKFFENLKGKYKGAFNAMRNLGSKMSVAEVLTARNAQFKFRMVSQGKIFGLGMSKNSWGEGELKIARRMADLKSGGKDSKGIVYWNADDKVFVFEGANVPAGAANATALKIALKKTIGYAPKVRLQKPGEKGEDSEGPEEVDPDAKAEAPAEGGKTPPVTGAAAAAAAAQLVAKLDGFKAKYEQRLALGGDDALKLKALDKGVRDNAARDPERANALLDGLVKLLSSAPAAGTPLTLPELEKAQKAWIDTRKRFESEVKALAASLDAIYREELATNDAAVRKAVNEAKAKLKATAESIGPELENALAEVLKNKQRDAQRTAAGKANATLEALLRRLMTDKVFMSLDGGNNELKRDMTVVKDVQNNLKTVRDALKI